MINTVIFFLLIGHFIADFYIQKNEQLNNTKSFKRVVKSSIIYLVVMTLVSVPIFSLPILLTAFLLSLTYFIINYLIFKIRKNKEINEKLNMKLFLIKQLVQLTIIVFVTYIVFILFLGVDDIFVIINFVNSSILDINSILSWVLAIIIVIKPVSVTIKQVLYQYRPILNEDEEGHPNAGSLIGILERCIILIFLFVGQYAAIGFVLTAKSIARYNKIVEDPKFSEYYLLGTLLSTLLVIITYLLVF